MKMLTLALVWWTVTYVVERTKTKTKAEPVKAAPVKAPPPKPAPAPTPVPQPKPRVKLPNPAFPGPCEYEESRLILMIDIRFCTIDFFKVP